MIWIWVSIKKSTYEISRASNEESKTHYIISDKDKQIDKWRFVSIVLGIYQRAFLDDDDDLDMFKTRSRHYALSVIDVHIIEHHT